MTAQAKEKCEVEYDGESFPHLHGTKCAPSKGHDGPRASEFASWHSAGPISWLTKEQKATRANR